MNKMIELVLASKSPFRRQIMENAGIKCSYIDAKIDERQLEKDYNQDDLAQYLAQKKALSAYALYHTSQEFCTIGCDQTLLFEGKILHKVKTIFEAKERLKYLSNKIHYLNSAYAIAYKGEIAAFNTISIALKMRSLSEEEIETYLEKERESLQSVGCYQIEKRGITLFEEIKGDYFAIIGLPLLPLLNDLRSLNFI